MNLSFPLQFDQTGRTATVDDERHIRNLIEQLLFTSPGERVNRPDFGSGLNQLIFAPNSDQLGAALQVTVQAALQQWLGHLIQVDAVEVEGIDEKLMVSIEYTVRRTGRRNAEEFRR